MLAPIRRTVGLGMRAVSSPLTRKVVHGARVVSDIASLVGLPGAAPVAKGLSVAENILERVQRK